MNLTALHSFINTKKEATEIIILFENLSSQIFIENFDLEEFLTENTPAILAKDILSAISENKINVNDRKALQEFFINAIKEIKNLPTVHMILAFEPKIDLIKQIQEWFYENLKKIVILDISVDPEIIAGSIISYQGLANEYTLANKIEQLSLN